MKSKKPISMSPTVAARAKAALAELHTANRPRPAGPVEQAIALAGLRQFLLQPRCAKMPALLSLAGPHFGRPRLENTKYAGSVVVFEAEDEEGAVLEVRCDVAAYALLLLIRLLGQSVFINSNGKDPFLKVCGRAAEKAGLVFARLLLGAEADEVVKYRNGNRLDLTFDNLALTAGASKRGTVDWYGQVLGYAAGSLDTLFPGTPEEKFQAAKSLLHSTMDLVDADRAFAKTE